MKMARLVSLPEFRSANGGMSIHVIEQGVQCSFHIRRVYWITSGSEASTHGHHAHLNADQMFVCTSGSAQVEVTGRDKQTAHYNLCSPLECLHVDPSHWLVVRLAPSSTLLCLSSTHFAEQETVYDMDEFLKGR